MKILWHNKRMGNNDLELTYSIVCSTDEIARETFDLLQEVQPYTISRDGIPDDLTVRMNKSPVSNLWKFARRLDDNEALLDITLESERPEEGVAEDEDELPYDKVYNHSGF